MNIFERLKAKETKFGSFLKKELALLLMICTILGGANEYLTLIPSDWIPTWAKTLIPIAGLISYVSGKLTVKKDESK